MRVVGKAGFEPRTLGTGVERATNCATDPVSMNIQTLPPGQSTALPPADWDGRPARPGRLPPGSNPRQPASAAAGSRPPIAASLLQQQPSSSSSLPQQRPSSISDEAPGLREQPLQSLSPASRQRRWPAFPRVQRLPGMAVPGHTSKQYYIKYVTWQHQQNEKENQGLDKEQLLEIQSTKESRQKK
jgi:hypothetical protein